MKNEKLIVYLLAITNFTHVIDFMIVMPLGPQLMRSLEITPLQFSYIVSSYTIFAAISGFLAAFFVDKYDRKVVLMWEYGFFLMGTLLCGLAQNYYILLIARALAGMSGGLIIAQVNSIVADLVPYERRGVAMGILSMAFSTSSVLGVPLGLLLANQFSWKWAFLFIVMLGGIVYPMIWFILPNMKGHLLTQEKFNPFTLINSIFNNKAQQMGIVLVTLVILGNFIIIPFIAPYMVANVGFTEKQLTYIYFIGGALTLLTSPLVGKIADKIGKFKVLRWALFLSVIPIFLITNLPRMPFYYALPITGLFFILISARFIPVNAIVPNLVPAQQRGGYMSLLSSAQNLTAGLASLIAGIIVDKNLNNELINYNYLGYIAISCTLLCLLFSIVLQKEIKKKSEKEMA
jgi:predicted MFS family arabinose efflux permease